MINTELPKELKEFQATVHDFANIHLGQFQENMMSWSMFTPKSWACFGESQKWTVRKKEIGKKRKPSPQQTESEPICEVPSEQRRSPGQTPHS